MGWIGISTLNTVQCFDGCNALEYIGPSGYCIAMVLQCVPPLCSVGFQCRAIDWGNHCSNASIVQLCHQMSILPTVVERKHDEPLNTGSVASTINIIGFHCFVECLNQYSQSFWMEEIKVSKHFKCFPWRKSIKNYHERRHNLKFTEQIKSSKSFGNRRQNLYLSNRLKTLVCKSEKLIGDRCFNEWMFCLGNRRSEDDLNGNYTEGALQNRQLRNMRNMRLHTEHCTCGYEAFKQAEYSKKFYYRAFYLEEEEVNISAGSSRVREAEP